MTFSREIIKHLRNAESICVLTGAGISAESGVPTFRGEEGLWKKFRPEELANFQAFIRNPDLVWEWYAYRRKLIHEVKPNLGHHALVELERRVPDFTLVTQNVDNLHSRAGSKNVVELHGNIERSYCIECRKSASEVQIESTHEAPRCDSCGGLIRPDVVWFGEMLPVGMFARAEAAARRCQVFLSIGTSSVVYPAASLPFSALEQGAYVVEVNREETDLTSRAHETLLGNSGEILPQLLSSL
ncbi:MAG TPA: NAD-dependent protein deacylase [Bacteroidetes bacterium]|nr:NAD-dependent protein deacylase [Bacteroidota bacterium]